MNYKLIIYIFLLITIIINLLLIFILGPTLAKPENKNICKYFDILMAISIAAAIVVFLVITFLK